LQTKKRPELLKQALDRLGKPSPYGLATFLDATGVDSERKKKVTGFCNYPGPKGAKTVRFQLLQ
jgi:hypothetical protein